MEWAQEEFDYALKEGLGPRKEHLIPWMHVSHITEVMRDRQALAIVRALWTRRDELAREYDIAPTLLLSDSSIIEVAKRKPHNAAQFRSIRSINERVRIHTDSEQDKMFERYAPIQRKIKPSMWKNIIQDALALPPSEWPDVDGGARGVMNRSQPRLPNRFACGRNGIRNVCKCSTGCARRSPR